MVARCVRRVVFSVLSCSSWRHCRPRFTLRGTIDVGWVENGMQRSQETASPGFLSVAWAASAGAVSLGGIGGHLRLTAQAVAVVAKAVVVDAGRWYGVQFSSFGSSVPRSGGG